MPEIQSPAYLGGSSDPRPTHTAQGDRLVLGSVFNAHNDTEGVLAGCEVNPAQSGLAVDIDPGALLVANPTPWGGPYHCASDSQVTVTLAPADQVQDRIDLIIAQVYDSAAEGSEDRWEFTSVTGVEGGGVPAVPDRALAIAQVDVAGAATSLGSNDLIDLRTGVATAARIGVPHWQRWAAPGGSRTAGASEASFIEHTQEAFDADVPFGPGDYLVVIHPVAVATKGPAVGPVEIEFELRVSGDGGSTWTTSPVTVNAAADMRTNAEGRPFQSVVTVTASDVLLVRWFSRRTDSQTGTVTANVRKAAILMVKVG